MYLKILITVVAVLFIFSSCSHLYEPALYHQDIAYMPKPASFDTAKTANYISIGYNANTNTHYNDFIQNGQINISRAYVFDNFNIAYGAFASLGEYQSDQTTQNGKTDPNYFTDKFWGAYGARASANFFVNSDNADIRFIGMEMAYSHEFGDYANFRQVLSNRGGSFVDPRKDLFTIGLTSEVLFHGVYHTGVQHGLRFFLGTTVGHNQLNDTFYTNEAPPDRLFREVFPRFSYFLKFKNYFGIAEIGLPFTTVINVRFGYKF